ncbi:hypothetical protein SAMN05421641_13122 [Paracoccus thiocyanatus]|uniref:Uncharacterized protein n=1 Tax=Paracoccus thiocyanatus TaxID=34006 RepID=A0A1N6Z6L7_9RHOB|nr:hypothetical protein [Paracoccus thiocyanatus]SIR22426.1 hypothetical protein SAMN05421641_13122 [Paracoccus thiocyanatus]
MTFFEFIVPVVALAVAGVGILVLRREERKLDRRNGGPKHHPAE